MADGRGARSSDQADDARIVEAFAQPQPMLSSGDAALMKRVVSYRPLADGRSNRLFVCRAGTAFVQGGSHR
ncbi:MULTISPECIES: hypothetical protein [unclassified Xanthomonas]|uniref:hypothetical protein n=1 Tax=unclassified Xanthomonas TaxID=2643310 RepID=UPI002B22D002|nr:MULTISPECIES: hypothetical protein [unclassified Xanthomonas]MEA9563665.1 hypothetical protein [Xanthomonas sp. WHRI 8932A]MEA9635006.1 hypothetical protein [Xanthomonas sp. WHRI 8812E]